MANLAACIRCGREASAETGVYLYPEGRMCRRCHTGRKPRARSPAQEPEEGPRGERLLTDEEMGAIAARAEEILEGAQE